MILRTYDNQEINLTKEQADAAAQAINAGAKLLKIGESYISASNVSSIVPGRPEIPDYHPQLEKPRQTPEQLEAQRLKMEEIRETILIKTMDKHK